MGSSSTMISYIKPMKTGEDKDDARSSYSGSGSGKKARSEVGGSSSTGKDRAAGRDYAGSTGRDYAGRKARSDVGGGGGEGKPLSHVGLFW